MINETQILMQLMEIDKEIGSYNTFSDGWNPGHCGSRGKGTPRRNQAGFLEEVAC